MQWEEEEMAEGGEEMQLFGGNGGYIKHSRPVTIPLSLSLSHTDKYRRSPRLSLTRTFPCTQAGVLRIFVLSFHSFERRLPSHTCSTDYTSVLIIPSSRSTTVCVYISPKETQRCNHTHTLHSAHRNNTKGDPVFLTRL